MSVVVGYASGIFDLFHVGHLNLLKQAKSQCDYLVAGVLTDEAAGHKGKSPMVPLIERLEIVASMACVDRVVTDESLEKLEAWEKVRFNKFFKGDDWRGTPKGDQWEKDFAGVGVEVVWLPYTMHVSSTILRKVISAAGEEPL
ncbi:adenylyltransferase/cytidyltransferase family protein [Streptomyces sp. NBC_01500]|uniref:adenylyltransferase/cytidyltransferase family protein n=1 Tax=Streptomyces sp. NBC_01500 TaxID=2903886 RepID=UPI002252BE8B|nr:adenylyltransferase/cytidyltransferase family protein [Streptomyces sp. NBC_01500]MCX4554149.1 adenylyltransferase/cytidyltransferase family protein [Streptomyces sp. NBC_01500]